MNALDQAQAELARDLRGPSQTPITDALAAEFKIIPAGMSRESFRDCRDSELFALARKFESDRAALIAALDQIDRLSREANRQMVDVASMLGDISRAALAKVRP